MKHESITMATMLLTTAILTVALGCSEDFEKFTDVTKLRVLGVQVQPAELSPGDTGEISALVVASREKEISYQWSWCPVVTTSLNGHQCPVDEAMLRTLIANGTGISESLIPNVSPFDLGTEPSARFPFVIDERTLQMVCEQVVSQFGDTLPLVPDCEDRLYTTIRLDVTDGEDTLTAVKQMNLLLSADIVPNQNPGIGAVYEMLDAEFSPLLADGTTHLVAGQKVNIVVDVAADASEIYETMSIETGAPTTKSESLFVTWFITGGETEFGRTSYIPNETEFNRLKINSWWPPSVADSNGQAALHVVLQDNRGGVSWASRTVIIEER